MLKHFPVPLNLLGPSAFLSVKRSVSHWGCILLLWAAGLPAYPAYDVEIDTPNDTLHDLLIDHLDLIRYQDREDMNQDQFDFLLATVGDQVKQIAATEGYFSATSTVKVEQTDEGPLVVLRVEPNQPTMVSNVDLALVGEATLVKPPRIDQMRKLWRLPVGNVFRQEDWDTAKARPLQFLQRRRYAAAKIAYSEARIDPASRSAYLDVTYDSGPVFTLGPLHVTGNKRYPASIIHNVSPLNLGEEYNVERLLELQRQIQTTPYFSNVLIDIDKDPAKARLTPVKVHVSEFPVKRFRGSAGFSSDTGARVEGRYSHFNVFKRAWVFESQAKIEQKRQLGSLELTMPPDKKGYFNSANTSIDRTTLEGVDLQSFRAGLKRTRPDEKYNVAWTLDYYRDELHQINATAPLPSQTIIAPGRHEALVPGFTWTRRNINNPKFPRKGNIINAQAGFAVKGLLTDQSFTRLYGRIRHYISITRKDIIILRGEGGGIFTRGKSNKVPASLLFRAGGTESIRGYSYQSIGNLQGDTVYPTRFLVSGGAEYQRWFTSEWGGAVFYDAGTASDTWKNNSLYQGVGVGARWRSPVGPVNVDVAYGIKDGKIRPHFSLGVAF